jgi:hypothetical protein
MLRSRRHALPPKDARRMNEDQPENPQRIPIASGPGNTPSRFTRQQKSLNSIEIRLF